MNQGVSNDDKIDAANYHTNYKPSNYQTNYKGRSSTGNYKKKFNFEKNYSKEKTAINTKNPNAFATTVYAANDDGYSTYFKPK